MPVTKGRERLAQVLKGSGELVTIDDASRALNLNRVDTSKILSRWQEQGLVKRIRRGVYAAVPMHALEHEQILENPWVIIPELFEKTYIGGWSAAEHWDLTEQLFRSVHVFTTGPVRRKKETFQGIPFIIKHIRERAFFGTKTLWRGRTKLQISDAHKTIVDMLDDPKVGGGIVHVTDCLKNYFSSESADLKLLIEYAEKMKNGAIFKRLGFLAELFQKPKEFQNICFDRLSKGNAKLDPSMSRKRLVTKWRLWIPEGWDKP